MRDLFVKIASAIFGLWLAASFVTGVEFTGSLKILAWAGLILGVINFLVRPILRFITLPLRILTLGLLGLVINMALIWLIDIFFAELIIVGILPLILTTLIIWLLNTILSFFFIRKK